MTGTSARRHCGGHGVFAIGYPFDFHHSNFVIDLGAGSLAASPKKGQGKCPRSASSRLLARRLLSYTSQADLNLNFLCAKLGNTRWCAELSALQSATQFGMWRVIDGEWCMTNAEQLAIRPSLLPLATNDN